MLRYISNWRQLNQIRYPCYLGIPRGLLLRLYLFICLQAVAYCLLPLPWVWLAYLMPVAGMIVFQMIAWLRVYKRFGYSAWPPTISVIILCFMALGIKRIF
ncbi:MAG: hypothetical protein J6D87_03015 [Clostridia bacterium]|nr:hypothetical protein [Clostridia bacterium]